MLYPYGALLTLVRSASAILFISPSPPTDISWSWNEKSIIFNTCWRQAIPVTGVEFRQPDRIKGLMLAPQPHNPNRFIRRNM